MEFAPNRFHRGLAWVAVLCALVYLVWWGILRGAAASGDLAVGYGAGSAWIRGLDPYDTAVLQAQLMQGGADAITVSQLDRLLNVYLPTTLPSFAPLTPLSWEAAKLSFLTLNVAVTAFIAWGMVCLLGWRRGEARTLWLVAFVLALAPLHTTIAIGQGAILSTGAIVAALVLERSGRASWAGVLYGIAIVVKVQIGLPFLVYVLWRRRWATGLTAIAIPCVVTLLSVLRMVSVGTPWFASWIANLKFLSGPGGINNPSPLNPDRYSLVNLQYLLQTFGIGGLAADLITYVAVGLVALLLVSVVRGRRGPGDLLAVSGVAVLCLLVTYHRYYDAVLLVLPIAWAMSIIGTKQRSAGIIALILCADFMFPFQTALHELRERDLLPGWLTATPLWDSVLITQHVWALLFLLVMLLAAARESGRSSTTPCPSGDMLG